jgi:DNA-binding MarR family transcriptional regulator
LDLLAIVLDVGSLAALLFVIFVGGKAIRAFKQSKQAVTEAGSLLGAIVAALSSRIELSESVVARLQSGFDAISRRSSDMEGEQAKLQGGYLEVLRQLENALSNDKRLITELEELKRRFAWTQHQNISERDRQSLSRQGDQPSFDRGEILSSLTPTERQTIEILTREGPKAAPDLGRRLKKSREHMARLMKKLYFEGYVDRETNRAPFRYRLNEKVRSNLAEDSISPKPESV